MSLVLSERPILWALYLSVGLPFRAPPGSGNWVLLQSTTQAPASRPPRMLLPHPLPAPGTREAHTHPWGHLRPGP